MKYLSEYLVIKCCCIASFLQRTLFIQKANERVQCRKIKVGAKLRDVFNLSLFFIMICLGCKGKPGSLMGKYKSVIPTFSNKNYTTGNTLILNVDSSFSFETCGEFISGTWKTNDEQDSLLLFFVSYEYKNDSLNKFPLKSWDKTQPSEKFKILSNGYLFAKFNFGYHKLKKEP